MNILNIQKIQKAENFIYEHKKPVYAALIAAMLCCLCITAIGDIIYGRSARPVSYTITDKDGENISDAVDNREVAMKFGQICINNSCSKIPESTFHISDDSRGRYTVYQDRGELDFDGYYKLYPHAIIETSGKIDVHIHRRF